MAWFLLIVAGVLEAVWAYFMKQSDGFTKLWPSAITLVTLTASFILLAVSMKTLPLDTSYMVWTGIGAVGAFLAEIILLGGAGQCWSNIRSYANYYRHCDDEDDFGGLVHPEMRVVLEVNSFEGKVGFTKVGGHCFRFSLCSA